jgi:predicted nucleic acid-binding Zn ribbon protein
MTRRRRDEPVALGDAIAAVNRELGLPEPDALHALAESWRDIVGPAIALHAEVRSVRDGVCTIAVDGPGWATQLRYLESQVVEAAAQHCGAGVVSAIRVVVAGPRRTG